MLYGRLQGNSVKHVVSYLKFTDDALRLFVSRSSEQAMLLWYGPQANCNTAINAELLESALRVVLVEVVSIFLC